MNAFLQEATDTTPYVRLDPEAGVFEITGRSIPINAEEFYSPIIAWLEGFKKEPVSHLQFIFKLEFFNIASSKRLLFILYKLKEIQEQDCKILIKWHYDKYDEDMLEIGHDYAILVDSLVFRYEEYDSTLQEKKEIYKFG